MDARATPIPEKPQATPKPTVGSLFAGIGGFPCQDVSTMGRRRGLSGSRTGRFFDAMHIVRTLQPRFVVLENVPGLLSSNHGRDFETVIETLAQCGYVGFWRVLDASYFGVPTKRRRVFMAAGLGEMPPLEFMADAGSVDDVSGKAEPGKERPDTHPTLLAGIGGGSTIDLSCANIVAVAHGRDSMALRTRKTEDNGFLRGMGAADAFEARCAGNAVVPQVARWIAEKLITAF